MLKLTDNRSINKMIPFKDLAVGTVFEHPGLKMIFMKIEPFRNICEDERYPTDENYYRNAVRLDNRECARGKGCGESWHIDPEGFVHPVSAELVIIE